jgi:hypothetical protein
MDLPPLSHQALFAAVRSADAAAVRALLADAESSGTSLAALAAAQTDAGETALYVAAEAGSEEVVRLLLPLYDLEAATVRSRLDLNAFHVAAKQGHTGELSPLPPCCPVRSLFVSSAGADRCLASSELRVKLSTIHLRVTPNLLAVLSFLGVS